MSPDIEGGKMRFISDASRNIPPNKNKWNSTLWMYLPWGMKYPNYKRILDTNPIPVIVTDIIKKNCVGRALKSELMKGGSGGRLGQNSKVKINRNL